TAGSAAIALGSMGLVQVAGRSVFAPLTARISASRLGTWVLAAKAAGIALLLTVPGVGGVVAFVAVYGAANGLATLTRAIVLAELYGVEHYGAISAVVHAVGAVAGALAPFAVAAAIALVGRDAPVFWGLVAISAVGSLT